MLPVALALPLAVQAQDTEDTALWPDLLQLVMQFRDADCSVSASDMNAFLRNSGISDGDRVDLAMNTAALDGLVIADFSNGPPVFTLAPALCDPLGTADMRATLTLVLRMGGCTMVDDVAETVFGRLGLTGDDTVATAGDMVAAGELVPVGDGGAQLSAALCEGTDETFASLRGAIYSQMRDGNCVLDEDSAEGVMAHPLFAGLPIDALEEMARVLADTGAATEISDGYRMSAEICPG